MKIFAKSVTLALGIALSVLPLLGLVPCLGNSCATHSSAMCCGMMDEADMASMPQAPAISAVAEWSTQSCDCTVTSASSEAATIQESERFVVPQSLSGLEIALSAPNLARPFSELQRRPLANALHDRPQAVLCTFLI